MNLLDELYTILYLAVVQFRMIFLYWVAGTVAGSLISVFASVRINRILSGMSKCKFGFIWTAFASLLGAASPICMYGTVPLIASLGRNGIPNHLLASFMVSSILINPSLFVFSFALGTNAAFIRLFVCIAAGIMAGVIVQHFLKGKELFDFNGFESKQLCEKERASIKTLMGSFNRAITKTAPYFLTGILLTALFDRYIQEEWLFMASSSGRGLEVVLAASLGVPVYVCGGGTIPLLKSLLDSGMSMGSALAFMIAGPATKLTNLSAVKAILGVRNFTLYIIYCISFAIIAGWLTDWVFITLRL